MKMRKIALITASLLLVATLGSCRRGKGDSSSVTSGSETTSETSQSSQGGSSATSGKTSSSNSSSSKSSSSKTSSSKSSSSKSSSSQTSSTPVVTHTAEEVIQEIVQLTFEETPVEDDNYFYDATEDVYYTVVSFGTDYADDKYLLAAISTLVDGGCLPSYIEVYQQPSVYQDETGNYAYGLWITTDEAVGIELISYVYDTDNYGLCCDICTYDL